MDVKSISNRGMTYLYIKIHIYVSLTYFVFHVSGPHRPLWPKYGEYAYVPPQRWLHSIEVSK